MKKLLTLVAMTLVAIAISYGQWSYVKSMLPAGVTISANGGHGIAVSPDNRIWMIPFDVSDSVLVASSSTFRRVRAIYVVNPDGTPAPFSPIKTIVVGGVRDTLYNSSRGLKADNNGNILLSSFDVLYRINYQTGAGMNKVIPQATQNLTAVAADSLGEIFAAKVLDGLGPIQIFASNFSSLGNVVDTSRGFSRTIEVSRNGNDVYFPGYTTHRILRYHSDFGSFGPYVVGPNDTLFKGFDCESMAWAPAKGTRPRLLWASTGSDNDLPNRYPGATTSWRKEAWYAWNPTTNTIVDSLRWNLGKVGPRPRGIAFSVTGDTAYVTCFNGDSLAFQMHRRLPTSVEPDPTVIPEAFTLSQNYPNPFNPSTEIKFTLTQSGFTTLKVYNTLGQEVATLVNENLNIGGYTARFSATELASGTYVYRLTTNGQTISKKMMLLK